MVRACVHDLSTACYALPRPILTWPDLPCLTSPTMTPISNCCMLLYHLPSPCLPVRHSCRCCFSGWQYSLLQVVQRAIAALGRGLAHHAAATDHRLEKLYWCHQCHYRSDSKSNLLRHLRTHTGEKRHGCPVCPYRAGQRSDLRRHLRVHAQRISHDTLQCRLCDFTTATPVGFAMHILDSHSTNTDQHEEEPTEDPLAID